MARVTVEDCLTVLPNRFDLILTASKRARAIANGSQALIDEENDKPTVIALREIAEGILPKEPEEEIFGDWGDEDEETTASDGGDGASNATAEGAGDADAAQDAA